MNNDYLRIFWVRNIYLLLFLIPFFNSCAQNHEVVKMYYVSQMSVPDGVGGVVSSADSNVIYYYKNFVLYQIPIQTDSSIVNISAKDIELLDTIEAKETTYYSKINYYHVLYDTSSKVLYSNYYLRNYVNWVKAFDNISDSAWTRDSYSKIIGERFRSASIFDTLPSMCTLASTKYTKLNDTMIRNYVPPYKLLKGNSKMVSASMTFIRKTGEIPFSISRKLDIIDKMKLIDLKLIVNDEDDETKLRIGYSLKIGGLPCDNNEKKKIINFIESFVKARIKN